MIKDNVYQVDWGITIRHDDACKGNVWIQPRRSDNSTVQPGAGPAPASISARCDKCGWLEISHIAIYAFDAGLASLADTLGMHVRTSIPIGAELKTIEKCIKGIRDRAAINTGYGYRA